MRRYNFSPLIVIISIFVNGGFHSSAQTAVNVTQHHNHYTRDGLYIDPAFTYSAATNLVRDTNFNGTISGNVYAQPLYIENGPGGQAMVIAVTESNNVYALNASSGNVIWQDHLGAPVPLADLPCGDIDPLGITGTPVVDLTNRTLFVDAMTTPDGGTTKRHLIYALNVDTGATNSGWPIDVNATVQFNGTQFTSGTQQQRAALTLLGGYVYVPFGGLGGDCGIYHGWLVGVQENNPASVQAWATSANGGAIWAPSGVSSDDGIHPYVSTGNTGGTATWSGGEAVIRFQPGPVFSGLASDFWAPVNWQHLDAFDLDLGDSGALMVDVPGATPSQLVAVLGKDSNTYFLNRTNLGGIGPPLSTVNGGTTSIIQLPATYRTSKATYITFIWADVGAPQSSTLVGYPITPANPPTVTSSWIVGASGGQSTPFVTSTDGTNNVIVWTIGSEGNQRLRGYNGDTGAVIFNGGGTNELMTGTRRFNTGIAARGRIYIANDNKVYAFTVPVPSIVLNNLTLLPNRTFQFGFTNTPGLGFIVYGTTNLTLPFTSWTPLGFATETSPGQFQFSDTTTSNQERFYRVTSQ
jgi:hypothetical protein